MQFLTIVAVLAAIAGVAHGAALDVKPEEVKTVDAAVVIPEELINEDCHQPRETGRCFALFHRYAFNVENRACEEFIYGGCAGNKNNFETMEACEQKCMKQAVAAESEVDKAPKTEEAPKEETSSKSV